MIEQLTDDLSLKILAKGSNLLAAGVKAQFVKVRLHLVMCAPPCYVLHVLSCVFPVHVSYVLC